MQTITGEHAGALNYHIVPKLRVGEACRNKQRGANPKYQNTFMAVSHTLQAKTNDTNV